MRGEGNTRNRDGPGMEGMGTPRSYPGQEKTVGGTRRGGEIQETMQKTGLLRITGNWEDIEGFKGNE